MADDEGKCRFEIIINNFFFVKLLACGCEQNGTFSEHPMR